MRGRKTHISCPFAVYVLVGKRKTNEIISQVHSSFWICVVLPRRDVECYERELREPDLVLGRGEFRGWFLLRNDD